MIGLLARPRLIAYGLAGAAILGAAGLAWWRVSAWRSAYHERPALVAERDAAVAARAKAEQDVLAQVAHNQEIERVLTDRFLSADGRARDLARRLLQASRQARSVCPPVAAPVADDGAGREPGRDRAVEDAVAGVIAAGDRDAARLTGLQAYVRALPARCVPD